MAVVNRQSVLAHTDMFPDWPHAGINYLCLHRILKTPSAVKMITDAIAERFRGANVTTVVGMESQGFIFGPLVAQALNVGFVQARKPGKMPGVTVRASYDNEYAKDSLEIQRTMINAGDTVLIVDDFLATGGTAIATRGLVEQLGGKVVGYAFVGERKTLPGRANLEATGLPVFIYESFD